MNSGFNLLTEISTKSKFPLSTASMASSGRIELIEISAKLKLPLSTDSMTYFGRIELMKLKISQKYFSSVKITSRQ
ncbi:5-enolpyruvylshikimate-3-phosphate synthase [Lactococcus lactis subsp. lactis]|uniref:5-enolpyruvylshikimate-3-phosphate synthase n=1 Tax=Lactococcus lactis subsp. lactis TaxID=1360 RepID=A0A0B8QU73_LACLL|nr:5-enolpyruvylshikimate-3-phosphate synthase [Lactococcus lactis subsp. lactis]